MLETGIFKSFLDQATAGFLANVAWLANEFKVIDYRKVQEKEYNGIRVRVVIKIEGLYGKREIE